ASLFYRGDPYGKVAGNRNGCRPSAKPVLGSSFAFRVRRCLGGGGNRRNRFDALRGLRWRRLGRNVNLTASTLEVKDEASSQNQPKECQRRDAEEDHDGPRYFQRNCRENQVRGLHDDR